MKTRNTLAIIILAIGLTQMAGYLSGWKILRGIGLASGIAPFPKVFSESDGYEPFAASFRLLGEMPDGSPWSCELTSERYSMLSGPYNRRNVHGAALAFAPRLPAELRDSLLSLDLAPGSQLRQELKIPDQIKNLRVEITPRVGEPHGPSDLPRIMKTISPWQFTLFRIIFGTYLFVHFIHLVPWAGELFGKSGVLPDPTLNPTHGLFPNPLNLPLADGTLIASLIAMAVCSALFAAGIWRRVAAALLWFGWSALFHRNNLIANPSIPYIGLLLILSILVPTGEPLGRGKRNATWFMPYWVFASAWILLAAGYTFSGYTKLFSASWVDGSAIGYLLENPLARLGLLRDLMGSLPDPLLAAMTWGALAAELLFLPLALWGKSRPWIWLTLVLMHLGIVAVIDFADLSLGMLIIHLFTFDPSWLRPKSAGTLLVRYDSECLMCSKSMRFLAEEDRADLIRFTPLTDENPTSIQVVANNCTLTESRAILALLSALGGHWRAISILGKIVPPPLSDILYRFVARHRYQWFGKTSSCDLPSASLTNRIL